MTLYAYSGLFADDLDRNAEQLNQAALEARQDRQQPPPSDADNL